MTLALSVDGKVLKTVQVDTRLTEVTRVANSTQRTSEEVRVHMTEGPHTFRAAFVDDAFGKGLAPGLLLNTNRNIFADTMEIAGHVPDRRGIAQPEENPDCDPGTGAACVERIFSTLARRAYRRPVTKTEVADLVKVYDRARSTEYKPDQALQFAVQAMLISPQFLLRIEHDPPPGAVAHISDVELASRLSYFLWSSMPDDELLRLAETATASARRARRESSADGGPEVAALARISWPVAGNSQPGAHENPIRKSFPNGAGTEGSHGDGNPPVLRRR